MNLSFKTKFALLAAVIVWASAFVGIRAGLQDFSPGGLALIRYLIASFIMFFIYIKRKDRRPFNYYHLILALSAGVIGIGIYNITLNYGELVVPSGMASFIISQSPIITVSFAVFILGERIDKFGMLGMLISGIGVAMIAFSDVQNFDFYLGIFYIIIATIVGSLYSIFQKSLLKKYDVIELTTYAIWGGTLILLFFTKDLINDLSHSSLHGLSIAIYLGIFPTVLGYLAWNYALSQTSASRAVSFLYFTPVVATLIGWIWLKEIPVMLAFIGGMIALFGVYLVNQSFKKRSYLEAQAEKALG
jgi:drug/metabolite transporter (DMT)-like permease